MDSELSPPGYLVPPAVQVISLPCLGVGTLSRCFTLTWMTVGA